MTRVSTRISELRQQFARTKNYSRVRHTAVQQSPSRSVSAACGPHRYVVDSSVDTSLPYRWRKKISRNNARSLSSRRAQPISHILIPNSFVPKHGCSSIRELGCGFSSGVGGVFVSPLQSEDLMLPNPNPNPNPSFCTNSMPSLLFSAILLQSAAAV